MGISRCFNVMSQLYDEIVLLEFRTMYVFFWSKQKKTIFHKNIQSNDKKKKKRRICGLCVFLCVVILRCCRFMLKKVIQWIEKRVTEALSKRSS